MFIVILLVVICTILILAFIKLKGVSPLVKALLYLYVNMLLREGFAIVERNFKLIERDSELIKWITLVIYGIAWNPVLISFVILTIWKLKIGKKIKIFLYLLFVLLLSSTEVFWNMLGYIHYNNWNFYFSAIRYTIVVFLSLIFIYWLDKKVIKI